MIPQWKQVSHNTQPTHIHTHPNHPPAACFQNINYRRGFPHSDCVSRIESVSLCIVFGFLYVPLLFVHMYDDHHHTCVKEAELFQNIASGSKTKCSLSKVLWTVVCLNSAQILTNTFCPSFNDAVLKCWQTIWDNVPAQRHFTNQWPHQESSSPTCHIREKK